MRRPGFPELRFLLVSCRSSNQYPPAHQLISCEKVLRRIDERYRETGHVGSTISAKKLVDVALHRQAMSHYEPASRKMNAIVASCYPEPLLSIPGIYWLVLDTAKPLLDNPGWSQVDPGSFLALVDNNARN